MSKLNNKLYAYLYHLNILINQMSFTSDKNFEFRALVKKGDDKKRDIFNHLLVNLMNLKATIKGKNEINHKSFFYQVEQLSLLNHVELEKCELCDIMKLSNVHHCSICNM